MIDVMKTTTLLPAISLLSLAITHADEAAFPQTHEVGVETFGPVPNFGEVKLFTLTNKNGLRAKVSDLGATLVSMEVPDKNGKLADITHGFESPEGYLSKGNPYFGATVGRFGNRIKDGRFTLDGKAYNLATNNEPGGIPCHLHGGNTGFDKVVWKAAPNETNNSITFTYISSDGEEGYPGTLTSKVTYTLTEANELKWEAEAITDAPTIVNLLHHSYWNLSGDPTTSINDHLLTLEAAYFLPTNAGLIPTGEKSSVQGTPMDFTKPVAIGERLNDSFEPLKLAGGYDHAWVLKSSAGIHPAARLKDPKSGRVLEISTNQPAIQFYGGNFLNGAVTGKKGVKYGHRTACCLETENFPDAPNQPSFPSGVLRPGEIYRHVMIHKFSAE